MIRRNGSKTRLVLSGYRESNAATEGARRRLMQLKIDTKHFISQGPQDEGDDSDLKILLQNFPDDGNLLFLLGRCYEEEGGEEGASSPRISTRRRWITSHLSD